MSDNATKGTTRRLAGYLRPYLRTLIVASLALALSGALMSLVIATFKPLFNQVLLPVATAAAEAAKPESRDILDVLSRWLPIDKLWSGWRSTVYVNVPLWIVTLFVVRSVALYFGQYLAVKAGVSLVRDLRADLYGTLIGQSPPFFMAHPTGSILSRVVGDVQRIQTFSTKMLADLFRVSAMVPFLIFVAFWHDWKMSALTLFVLPVLAYPMVRIAKRLRKAARLAQSRTADLASRVTETVQGIRIVQAFGQEDHERDRFAEGLGRIMSSDLKAGRAGALAPSVMELIGAIAAGALFYAAGLGVSRGVIDRGDVFVVLASLGLLFMSIRRLNTIYVDFQQAHAAGDRVFALIDTPRSLVEAADAVAPEPFHDALLFENVRFAYEEDEVLQGIDLTLKRGEVVALVGASGSGKSTLAMLVPRFFDPTSGRVTLDGVDLRKLTLGGLRKQIGIVSQEPVLFDESVLENIQYGRRDASWEEVQRVARAAVADEFIQRLPKGYDTVLGERGSRLSVGQRQRLTIARALLADAPILILDEATSALDSESETKVQRALETLMAGRTTLVIAHRLATVRRADRIVVLEAGRIVETGSHVELLRSRGLYAHLHALQFEDPEGS